MREQSWEILDLKEQVVQLQQEKKQITQRLEVQRDGVQSTEDDREQLRKEREHLLGHIQQQEYVITRLRHERCNRKEHIQSLTMQTRDAVQKQENLEDIIRKLTKVNEKLSEDVTACTEEIFRLQPRNEMPDSELSDQYSTLHQLISHWVSIATKEPEQLEERLESLPSNVDEWPEPLRTHLGDGHVRLAKKYPVTQPLMLKYFIDCFLAASILSEDTCLFGLDSGVAGFMRDTEQGMKLLEPKRGRCRRAFLQQRDGLLDQPYSRFGENLT
jgi:DNA repair exonuclease SbcCD ATPase subunit